MIKKIWIDGEEYTVDVSYYILKEAMDSKHFLDLIKNFERNSCQIVSINPRYVISYLNVIVAIQYALRAFKRARNISRVFPIEVLLYLAGRREISYVVQYLPPLGKVKDTVLALICKDNEETVTRIKNTLMEKLKLEASSLSFNEEKVKRIKEFYSITDKEIKATSNDVKDAIIKLIAIRSALLSIS